MVILFALVFSLFRAVIPYITDYGDDIEQLLTAQLGMPVEIGMVDADISWLIPSIKLLDVSIYDEKRTRHFLYFREISISLNWSETIANLQPALGDIYVSGMNLQIERDRDGKFLIQGMKIPASNGDDVNASGQMMSLFDDSSIYLVDSSIHWFDHINNSQRLGFTKLNITMLNNGGSHRISIETDLPASYGRHLKVITDFEGRIDQPELWKGRAYVALDNFQLDAWLNDYWEFVEFPGAGEVTANAWLSFDQFSIQSVTGQFEADDLVLYHFGDELQSWKLDHVSFKAKWSDTEKVTSIDVRDLYLQRKGKQWKQKSAVLLSFDENNRVNLKTDYVRLEDLLYIFTAVDVVSNQSSFDAVDMVDISSVKGDLYDVSVSFDPDDLESITTDAYFEDLGYLSTSKIPSVHGLDGYIHQQAYQGVLNLVSEDVALEFNGLFRNSLLLNYIESEIRIAQKDNGLHIESDYIFAQTPHISTYTKLHVEVPNEGATFLNIVSQLRDGDGAFTGLYLPAGIMSKDTVNWLDHAIVRADIPDGGFLFYGETADFPFKQGEGVMEVLFDIEDARLEYLPGWPAITGLQSSVLFYNSSFSMKNATGYMYGADLTRTNIAIDDMNDAHLSIDGDIVSPLSDLLLFVRNSPLKESLGPFVAGLKGRGKSSLKLDLQIPLSSDDVTKVLGELEFKNNEILLPDQGYLLSSVNGQMTFTESFLRSENLQATMDDHEVTIDIRPETTGNKTYTHISASGYLPVKTVLSPVPVLKSYLDGKASWDVNIDLLGASNKGPLANIQVSSDLKGVASSLPVPFSKAEDTALPVKLSMDIMPDDSLNLMLNYHDLASLDARYAKQLWSMGLKSSELRGKIQFSAESFQDNPVNLKIDYLNLSAYMQDDTDLEKTSFKPMDLPVVSLQAGEIIWKKTSFKNINLKTHKTHSGLVVDNISFDVPNIHLTGKGSWLSSWRIPNRTEFDFSLSSKDLGRGLSTLGISKSIKDTKGSGHFKWAWNDAPYNFSWDKLEGSSTLNLKDGRLVDFEPGAGRILGILNFETLLSLDFGKQVSGGFAFDKMRGSFRFSEGDVFTDDFSIKGKVADIAMKGRVGLAKEDYDQVVTVTPGVGSTLSVIGTVAGGATIGAAILFFQKILGLDKIAEYKYSVTGSWENPRVKLLSAPEKQVVTEEYDDDF